MLNNKLFLAMFAESSNFGLVEGTITITETAP